MSELLQITSRGGGKGARLLWERYLHPNARANTHRSICLYQLCQVFPTKRVVCGKDAWQGHGYGAGA